MQERDHGGGLDAAITRWGGDRSTWIDLSTGINPEPYPLPSFTSEAWTALPDKAAQARLIEAARSFWNVPAEADILAAPGASSLIARMPQLFERQTVDIPKPTYNEHAAAFAAQGWVEAPDAPVRVLVHPNNPTGQLWSRDDLTAPITVIDESFCDVTPENSLISESTKPSRIILKSFGKFWGLAGLRLGFLIGAPDTIQKMRDMIGPWAVSGPALEVATLALLDQDWATESRARLAKDTSRLDGLMTSAGAVVAGGCDLFRLYEVDDAQTWHDRLGENHILTRIFPYSKTYLRLGFPAKRDWSRLEAALKV
ncbi:threonine-phosphate decarboxylase [Cognatishimia maritima]|uniref:Aminotransferase n=1 Tax=Cognatishimia maritima TaxID=870908 RepID=A0A1M5NDK7_9RHOB|nr:threonine-phosphate decarboxylase [Cognatishimia maritima]SHG87279.1 L-threonine O-3-phosphate decarboxylase [Cognatishimia maritima]